MASTSTVATGGSVQMTGATTYAHSFTEPGSLVVTRAVTARYLVAGGGGAPAHGVGGGGGGGEVKTGYIKLEPGTYAISVGKSSAKLPPVGKKVVRVDHHHSGNPESSIEREGAILGDAESSSFGTIVALGGKAGAPSHVSSRPISNASGVYINQARTPGGASGNGYKGGASKTFLDCLTYVNAPGAGGGAAGDAQAVTVTFATSWCTTGVNGSGGTGGKNPAQPFGLFLKGGPGIKSDISGQMVEYGAGQSVIWNGTRPSGYSSPQDGVVIVAYDETSAGQSKEENIAALRAEYDAKMKEYEAAKAAEIKALAENNQAALDAALAAQRQAAGQLQQIKSKHDAAMAKLQTLEQQLSGSNDTLASQAAQIAELRQKLTATPAPTTVAPTSVGGVETWNKSVYVFVAADEWQSSGQLKVLSLRDGVVDLEPFVFKTLSQCFVSSSSSKIRSLQGAGLFLGTTDGCTQPVGAPQSSSTWRFQRVAGGHPLHYHIVSTQCGRALEAMVGTVTLASSLGPGWYAVRVGSLQ
jgi:hypothetical protein